ncbi:protein-L-isoaspartate(D-aspartate) O-methyltransferase [bacterium]|nr:protein-L-isoaspartate(D-aspartate) O-methyltransferase [bacterium]
MSWFREMPRHETGLALSEEWFADACGAARRRMVEDQIWARGIRDPRVLEAMARVPRHQFVDPAQADRAYEDCPLSIGFGQTISQPYMVARMTELARVSPGGRVLEIGVGCGYQTAILLTAGARVEGIEIIPQLANAARDTLTRLGFKDFKIHIADGFEGYPAGAPYEAVVLGAAPVFAPEPLLDQLGEGGRMVAPLGYPEDQRLWVITREGNEYKREELFPVRFVPMVGKARGE